MLHHRNRVTVHSCLMNVRHHHKTGVSPVASEATPGLACPVLQLLLVVVVAPYACMPLGPTAHIGSRVDAQQGSKHGRVTVLTW